MIDKCDENDYQELIINSEPDSITFDASSEFSRSFGAEEAILGNEATDASGGSWVPADTNQEQW